jgi:hypothetical protein
MTPAERAKLHRSRQAMGRACYRVEIDPRIFGMLVAGGLLNDNEADDKEAVAAALEKALDALADMEESSRVTAMARGERYHGFRKEHR